MPSFELADGVELLSEEHANYYRDMGYEAIVKIHGKIVACFPFLFTHAIVVGLDETGYECRYCYETRVEALSGLALWMEDGGEEPYGYIKRKPERHEHENDREAEARPAPDAGME